MKNFLLIGLFLPLAGFGCITVKTASIDSGGVYVTTSAGAKWTSKSLLPTAEGVASIDSANVNAITFDPQDPDVLYLGTASNGLLVSYDNAESWQRIKEPQMRSGSVSGVIVDAKDVCTVYVAKSTAIMKSTDCLRSFDPQTFVAPSGDSISTLRADWYNNQNIWLTTSAGDIVKSVDAGKTWSTVERTRSAVVDLLVSNADSRVIFALTTKGGMYRTNDSGAFWHVFKEEFDSFKELGNGYQLVQSKDGSILFLVCDYGILRSTDQGASWTALTLLTKPSSTHIYSMAVNPADANTLYYSTDTTFYSSTDGGVNWSTRQLPTSRAVTAMVVDPNDSSLLMAGFSTVQE